MVKISALRLRSLSPQGIRTTTTTPVPGDTNKKKRSVALPDIESVYCENEYGVRSPGVVYCNGPEGSRSCKVQRVHLLAARRAEL